ncbi:hypothetical protein D3C78_1614170 [compost metagenome]
MSVSQPPTVGPIEGAKVVAMPKSAMPTGSLEGGSIPSVMVMATGIITPPVKPCRALNTFIEGMFQAKAHSVEKTRNSATLASM